ncbi:thiamine phosphate synthase [Granulicella sp. 5B5]|nr:thiamine phosphate synthase [Granulicella sp. 5B5]
MPRLYAIADRATLDARSIAVADFAAALVSACVGLVQYRDKVNPPQQILAAAAEITSAFASRDCLLVMNDRADLAALAGWSAVHVGQGDLFVADAQQVLSRNIGQQGIVGLSTHTDEQVLAADQTDAAYIAIGPVFSTTTKPDAEQPVGLEGVRRARSLTSKPLVAIGGITRYNASSVLDAGADSVAVISGLFAPGQTLAESVEDFLACLR